MNFLSTCRAIALFASAFACAIASVPSVHAEAAATTSLTDIPYAVDPGFPLVSRRDVIVGGSSVGATALIELAPGGDVILGGLVSGSLVLQRVAPDGTRGSWPVTTAANPGLLQLDPPAGAPYLGVSDIKVFDNRLFVLVDRQRSSSVTTRDVYVLVFGVDGTFLSSYLAMGDFRDEHGAGLAIYQTFGIGVPTTTFVSVVGHRALDAVESNPFLTRARLQGDSLVRDTTIGDANGYVQLPVPGALCAPYNEACSMEVARTVVKPTGAFGTTPILYVAGSIRTSGDDWDYALLCISASGTPCSDFGNGGFVRRGFNNGGSLADRATDIAVRRFGTFGAYVYTVYLTGNVARRCQGGVGAMAFDGSDGSVEFGFGLLGRVLTSVAGALGVSSGEASVVGRVVAQGGDAVRCCDEGYVWVEGDRRGRAPEGTRAFDFVVPEHALWILGDRAAPGRDSLAHADEPGHGAIPTQDVIGVVLARFWPLTRHDTDRVWLP